jgi:hypothetical protein
VLYSTSRRRCPGAFFLGRPFILIHFTISVDRISAVVPSNILPFQTHGGRECTRCLDRAGRGSSGLAVKGPLRAVSNKVAARYMPANPPSAVSGSSSIRRTEQSGPIHRLHRRPVACGYGRFTAPNSLEAQGDGGGKRTISFEQAIIPAGSEPVTLPFVPHQDSRVIDSTGALELDGLNGVPPGDTLLSVSIKRRWSFVQSAAIFVRRQTKTSSP